MKEESNYIYNLLNDIYVKHQNSDIGLDSILKNESFKKFFKFYLEPEHYRTICFEAIDNFITRIDTVDYQDGASNVSNEETDKIMLNFSNDLSDAIDIRLSMQNDSNESYLGGVKEVRDHINIIVLKKICFKTYPVMTAVSKVVSSQELRIRDQKKSLDDFIDNSYHKLRDLDNEQEGIKESIDTLNSDLEKSKEGVNEIRSIKSTIYTDFIAILGIFSALIFSLFGGFSSISNILTEVSGKQSISRIIISISLLGILLICLIFCLLQFIATMSNRSISLSNNKNPFSKYPIFIVSLIIFFIMAIIGLACMIFAHI
ncbi:hypothetical protein [Xylocopilactobacillus apicola]|uniref:Uncharacterized protein n=1 Tax=Xylocopilactobacillus apicola TaxID=2932184 RepID=A0AAU9DR44_9LACO|nr:hypothetical protein [Xylocopilactobacillus apicola]BDR57623.1 hypothetical protein XA3_00640 [Xylocopilactobacillus apicola]